MADIFDIEFYYCISVILYTIFQVFIRFSVCRDVMFWENILKLLFNEKIPVFIHLRVITNSFFQPN